MTYKFTVLPTNLLSYCWDDIRPYLERLIPVSRNEYTVKTVYDDIMSGKLTLMTITDGSDIIGFTTYFIQEFPTGKRVLLVHHLAGDGLKKWYEAWIRALGDLLKLHNAEEAIGLTIRKGWNRLNKGGHQCQKLGEVAKIL